MADRLSARYADRIVAVSSLLVAALALLVLFWLGTPGFVARQIWWILLAAFAAGLVTGWANAGSPRTNDRPAASPPAGTGPPTSAARKRQPR